MLDVFKYSIGSTYTFNAEQISGGLREARLGGRPSKNISNGLSTLGRIIVK